MPLAALVLPIVPGAAFALRLKALRGIVGGETMNTPVGRAHHGNHPPTCSVHRLLS
jgi:hypothetical protein